MFCCLPRQAPPTATRTTERTTRAHTTVPAMQRNALAAILLLSCSAPAASTQGPASRRWSVVLGRRGHAATSVFRQLARVRIDVATVPLLLEHFTYAMSPRVSIVRDACESCKTSPLQAAKSGSLQATSRKVHPIICYSARLARREFAAAQCAGRALTSVHHAAFQTTWEHLQIALRSECAL